IYGNLMSTLADARHHTADEMRSTIEEKGPFEAERAQQAGLVDELRYEDDLLDEIKAANGGKDVHKLSIADYSKGPNPNSGGERVALVYAVGTIVSGEDEFNPVEGGKTMGAKSIDKVLDDVAMTDP